MLFSTANGGQLPMMPLNSGSNSVSNVTIEKFLALDATQMFLLVRVNLMIFLCTIEYIKFSDSEVNKARIIKTSKLIILHAKKHHFIDVMLIKRLGG
mgnify:CR=1 FL=1